jgi:hypothetical protein
MIRTILIAASLLITTAAIAQQTETPAGNASPKTNCVAGENCAAAKPDATQSSSDRNEAGRASSNTAPTSGGRADGGGATRDPGSIHSGVGSQ